MSRQARFTARGPAAIALVVLLLFVRQLFVETLDPAEAESIVRSTLSREVWAHYDPLLKEPDGSLKREAALEYGQALEAVRRERYSNVRVKRTWIPPIMVRQPAFLVTLTRESSIEPEYYRVRGPFARRVSRLAWLFPIL
jgi:hypothetical protein